MTNEKIEQLERTVLELGTEIFRLKTEISSLKGYHENFVDIVEGLKKILDEKGLISHEDFDAAIDLGNAISMSSQVVYGLDSDLDKIKKTSH